jgi:hypothetical protein
MNLKQSGNDFPLKLSKERFAIGNENKSESFLITLL